MAREIEFRITKLERDEKGFWKCNVTAGGKTYPVTCKDGSWMYENGDGKKEVLPFVASAIQEKVRPIEKKERIAREKSEEENAGTRRHQEAA